jgi:hypothetical protein
MKTPIMNDRMKARIQARYHFAFRDETDTSPAGVEIYDKEIDEIVAQGLPSMDFALGFTASQIHSEDTSREWIQPMAVEAAA